MKRLLELQDPSPLIDRAQELIAAAEPIDASPWRRERIRRELDRPVNARAAFWTRVPALAVAGFVLLFGASSFAALRLWTSASQTEPPATAPERDATDGGRVKPRADGRESTTSTTQPSATDSARELFGPQPSASKIEARSNRSQRSSRRAARASARSSETATPAPAETVTAAPAETAAAAPAETADVPSRSLATSPNSELVVRAVRALRREGDPALAARLLDEYRARRSASPLGEEVSALQIEAAVANGDPRATRFAREYLTRYPAGRYAETARSALADLSP